MRFAPGARLGAFEILAPLGAGGMGEVYRARDTRLERTVALKVLPAGILDGAVGPVERFRREARAVARITHPNICTLHDLGEDGSTIFLVMEHVGGETLAQRLEDGPLPLASALRTAIQIADALDHAHRHGVVHRDLKPGNVMLTRDGVKLLDFGLARLRDHDDEQPAHATDSVRLTDPGTIVGTVSYMAPEQIEGHEVDGRTDLFALGVVLYEMVCGRRPFTGDSRAALMAAIVEAEAAPPAILRPDIPPALEHAMLRCLAKAPDHRWQTAGDLAAELRWIAASGGGATPAIAVQRHRWRRGVLAGVAAVVVAAALLAATTLRPTRTGAGVPEHRQVTYRRGAVSAARFTPDGRTFVYSASWEGQPYAAFLGRAENPDVRDLELHDARILSISAAGDMAVLFGRQTIQQTLGARTLARIPMAGGARRDLLAGVVDADWIPGTDSLAVVRDPGNGRPWVIEFPIGTPVHEARAVWSLRVSPDGRRAAFFEGPTAVFDSAPESMITVVDRSGATTTLARGLSGLGLAWTPSGREIWFTAARPRQQSTGPQLHAVSLGGVEREVYSAPDWLVLHDISAEGRVLLSRNSIRILASCRRPGDSAERELGWLVASFVNALSPDGRTLVFSDPLSGRSPAGLPTIFRRGTDGSPAVALGEARGPAALSPDGRWVVAELDGHLVLVPSGAGSAVHLPPGEVARVGGRAWLRDSQHVVFTGYDGAGQPRGYVQEIPAGMPRAFTRAGVVLAGKAAVRDERTVLGRAGASWALFPIDGGDAQPLTALGDRDLPVQWSADGGAIYAVDNLADEGSPGIDVVRVDVASGARVPWRRLAPVDAVGVQGLRPTVAIAPDAQSYCYSYMRRLGDLFVVDGLK